MKTITLPLFLLCCLLSKAQKSYKESTDCISYSIHKGKKDHGKPYCTMWALVHEYHDGRKDTVAVMGGELLGAEEYDKRQLLPERERYIVDSLSEDGIHFIQSSYLTYEPIYMKPGKKSVQLWGTRGDRVVIYTYLLWNNRTGNGIRLINELELK